MGPVLGAPTYNPLIFYSLSCITTNYLSKGGRFIVQASQGLTYSEVQEGLCFDGLLWSQCKT